MPRGRSEWVLLTSDANGDSRVEWVNYAGFPEQAQHALTHKYLLGNLEERRSYLPGPSGELLRT